MRIWVWGWVTALVVHAGLALAEPTAEQKEEGRRVFGVGVALLQDPDGARYEEARVQFLRAYELTSSWKVLGNLGLCQLKLERDGEAIETYTKYLAQGGAEIDAEERAQIERDLGVLKAQVVSVSLKFPEKDVTLIDERSNARGGTLVNEYHASGKQLSLGLHPGRHKLTARFSGNRNAVWETTLAPASTIEHSFELPAPGTGQDEAVAGKALATPAGGDATADTGATTRPIPTSVYITAGVTGALVIGAAVTGFVALNKRSQFDEINDPAHSEAEKNEAHDSAVTMSVTSTILTGAAVVGAAVTGYLYFTRPERPATAQARHRGPHVTPWVGVGAGGVVIGGTL